MSKKCADTHTHRKITVTLRHGSLHCAYVTQILKTYLLKFLQQNKNYNN